MPVKAATAPTGIRTKRFRSCPCFRRRRRNSDQGTKTTPHGRSPTFTLAFTDRLSTSTIDTSLDGPLAVNTVLPSGETSIPHGRSPTSVDATRLLVLPSITTTFLAPPVLTNTREPSGEATAPIGRTSSPVSLIVVMTVCFIASSTHTSPPFSAVTYARELSGRNAVDRGRRPTLTVASGFSASASMAVTWLSSSDVTYTT